jgi:hypothetical protein
VLDERKPENQIPNGISITYPGNNNMPGEPTLPVLMLGIVNDISWKVSYGALYNWYAINNSNGLCPTGWHVPSDTEWTQLVDYVVAQGFPNEWDNLNGTANALKSCMDKPVQSVPLIPE